MIWTQQLFEAATLYASVHGRRFGGALSPAGDVIRAVWEDGLPEPTEAELLAAVAPKVWHDAQAFMAEFSMPERAAIWLSPSPTIAGLCLTLSTWLGAVHADHEDVIMGLEALVSAEIITAERRAEILA